MARPSYPRPRSSMPEFARELQLTCPIGLFERIEPTMRTLTAQINSARDLGTKTELAHALIGQCEKLHNCESLDETNLNCRMCQHFSSLRQKTADLILKVARVKQPREGGAQ